MFFFLSKTIYFLAMPLPFVILLVIVSFFIRHKKLKSKLRLSAFVLLIFISNPYLANRAIKAWEGEPTPIAQLKHHKLAIVLTGVTNMHKTPDDRVYFERGADRVLHTIKLYKEGKIDNILISGGSGSLVNNHNDVKEADELARVFVMAGVPDRNILIENTSRNTHESAVNCAQIIKGNNYESILLVSSAFHLTRAKLAFENEGIQVIAFGVDYIGKDKLNGPDGYITPKPEAITNWNIIIKEMMGIVMYKLMGYV